jgi:hypothetical protein
MSGSIGSSFASLFGSCLVAFSHNHNLHRRIFIHTNEKQNLLRICNSDSISLLVCVCLIVATRKESTDRRNNHHTWVTWEQMYLALVRGLQYYIGTGVENKTIICKIRTGDTSLQRGGEWERIVWNYCCQPLTNKSISLVFFLVINDFLNILREQTPLAFLLLLWVIFPLFI